MIDWLSQKCLSWDSPRVSASDAHKTRSLVGPIQDKLYTDETRLLLSAKNKPSSRFELMDCGSVGERVKSKWTCFLPWVETVANRALIESISVSNSWNRLKLRRIHDVHPRCLVDSKMVTLHKKLKWLYWWLDDQMSVEQSTTNNDGTYVVRCKNCQINFNTCCQFSSWKRIFPWPIMSNSI